MQNNMAKEQYEKLDLSRSARRGSTQEEYKVDKERVTKKTAPKADSLYKQTEMKKVAARTGRRNNPSWEEEAERMAKKQQVQLPPCACCSNIVKSCRKQILSD